jgi:hypothetical protein
LFLLYVTNNAELGNYGALPKIIKNPHCTHDYSLNALGTCKKQSTHFFYKMRLGATNLLPPLLLLLLTVTEFSASVDMSELQLMSFMLKKTLLIAKYIRNKKIYIIR